MSKGDNFRTHGKSGTPTHKSWAAMRARCLQPCSPSYANYGGRGIRICERWLSSFENFLADMGEKPPGMFIDRIDPDLGYEPGNCKWSTRTEQNRNRRPSKQSGKLTMEKARDIRRLIAAGHKAAALADLYGVHVSMIHNIRNGKAWSEAA